MLVYIGLLEIDYSPKMEEYLKGFNIAFLNFPELISFLKQSEDEDTDIPERFQEYKYTSSLFIV